MRQVYADEEAPLAVVLLVSQAPVRVPSPGAAGAEDDKTEDGQDRDKTQDRRGSSPGQPAWSQTAQDLLEVWLGETELMSQGVHTACSHRYSTLRLGPWQTARHGTAPEHEASKHPRHLDAGAGSCVLSILVPCELLHAELKRARQDMGEDARVHVGAMAQSVGRPWLKSVVEMPLSPSVCSREDTRPLARAQPDRQGQEGRREQGQAPPAPLVPLSNAQGVHGSAQRGRVRVMTVASKAYSSDPPGTFRCQQCLLPVPPAFASCCCCWVTILTHVDVPGTICAAGRCTA